MRGLTVLSLCLMVAVMGSPLVQAEAETTHPPHHPVHHAQHDPLSGKATDDDGERNKHRDHEAVIGSRHEAEEADDLTTEQAKEMLEKLAHKHDLDKDGQISKDEFITWILQSFKSLDEEEAIERMKNEDENGDGKLIWEEYLHQQYDYSPSELEQIRATPDDDDNKNVVEMVDEDHKRFKGADLDNSNHLDQSEYVAFYHPYDYEHMHKFEIEHGIKDVDTDKDGKVSMKEYVGDIDDFDSVKAEEEQFKKYDANGDGFLEGAELKAWLIRDNTHSANEEVEHLMSIADVDKNGFLTIAEIKDKQEDFVSSQATDYGNTLEKMKDEL